MKNLFTVEESNLICIFQSDSRTEVMTDINRALEHIDDTDMIELCENVIKKLEKKRNNMNIILNCFYGRQIGCGIYINLKHIFVLLSIYYGWYS